MYIEPLFLVRKLVQNWCKPNAEAKLVWIMLRCRPICGNAKHLRTQRAETKYIWVMPNRSQVCGIAEQWRTKNGQSFCKFADRTAAKFA